MTYHLDTMGNLFGILVGTHTIHCPYGTGSSPCGASCPHFEIINFGSKNPTVKLTCGGQERSINIVTGRV